jgi:phosphoadenosine phosphosulfate reductase
MQTLSGTDLATSANERFASADPRDILRWAIEEAGFDRIGVASAFQAEGTVVMHMATEIRRDIPVLFLQTGFHFAETLAFKQQLTERLNLNVIDLVGDFTVESQRETFGDRLYERDPARCCDINKVQPMFRALRDLDAWVTAFRRDSAPSRANAPIVDRYDLEPGLPIVKINPVATWSRKQVWRYLKANDLPHNPLYDLGYASIGCAPCTRMQFPGENERAGRWADLSKWECGLHPESGGPPTLIELQPAP